MTSLYLFIALGVIIAASLLLAFKLGKSNEENKIAEANQKASEDAKKTAEAIINRTRGDGINNLKRLRKDKDK